MLEIDLLHWLLYHINIVFHVIVSSLQTKNELLTLYSIQAHFVSYIFMLYIAEQPELPVGPFGMDEGLERPIQLLDGHFLLGLLINSGAE